jgi:hypothetical protein
VPALAPNSPSKAPYSTPTYGPCVSIYTLRLREAASSRERGGFLTARPFFGEGGFSLGKPTKEALFEAELLVTGAPGP